MNNSFIEGIGRRAALSRMARSKYQAMCIAEHNEKTYSRNKVMQMLKLTNIKMHNNKFNEIIDELIAEGYQFERRSNNNIIYKKKDIYAIAKKAGVDPYSSKGLPAFVLLFMNLKGGVGKSLGTSMIVDAAVELPNFLLNQFRILIIDLDPQGSATQHRLGIFDGTKHPTSLVALCDSDGDLLKKGTPKSVIFATSNPNVDIMPADISDGFLQAELDNHEVNGGKSPYSLLQDNVINKVKYDYDFIICDVGPHMDTIMLNVLRAANGVFIPAPTNILDWDSTTKFMERLPSAFSMLKDEGYDPKDLKFIKSYISKSPSNFREGSQEANLYENTEKELIDILGYDNVVKHQLPNEDAYSRLGNNNSTVFTISKNSEYEGDPTALKRATKKAKDWAQEILYTILEHHEDKNNA